MRVDATAIARTMKEFDSAVIEILRANPKDMPFAALYHVDESSSSELSMIRSSGQADCGRQHSKTKPNRIREQYCKIPRSTK